MKTEYQKPQTLLIEVECETIIAGSISLTNDSEKDFGGIGNGSNGLSGRIKIDLSDGE